MALIYADLAEYLAAKFLSAEHYGKCGPDCPCQEIATERPEVRRAMDDLIAKGIEARNGTPPLK